METSHASSDATIKTSILLEDPSSGELFAEAPYIAPAVVEQALDSSRFFAVRVVGEGGMKATLGMGFEDRTDAFDFGVALQEVRKVLGWEGAKADVTKGNTGKPTVPKVGVKRNWSLKEGETLKVDLGAIGAGKRKDEKGEQPPSYNEGGGFAFLPPPPSLNIKADRRRSREVPKAMAAKVNAVAVEGKKLEELGFDDGEFGEFQ